MTLPSTSLAPPLSQASDLDEVSDAPLLRDIEMLSNMLADVVRKDSPKIFELYNHLRKLGIDRASDPNNTDAFQEMKKIAFDITPQDTLGVMRTFTLALNLINSAEVHHRLRVVRIREMEAVSKGVQLSLENDTLYLGSPLPLSEDSVRGTIETILTTDAMENNTVISKDQIYQKLITQKVEIVLTAHPTEVNRKTLLRKYRRITETLAVLDRPDLHPYERSQGLDTIRRNIAALWGSDEIRRKKPTPQQEAAGGNAVVETVLWEAVPSYLRKLDAQCRLSLGQRLPIDIVPVKFSSWMGGDRDGNPNVTPSVTKEVVLQQRLRAAKLYWNDLNELYSELAISYRFSPEMEELAATVNDSPDVIEKYRRVIGNLRLRLLNTVRLCETELESLAAKNGTFRSVVTTMVDIGSYIPLDKWADLKPIMDSADLMKPLKIMYESLMATGFELVADGRLLDIIRRLATFGLTLLTLDIREESTKHTEALDAITRYLGIGSYSEWDEDTRLNFLTAELASKRPLIHISSLESLGFSPSVLTTLQIFQTASGINPEALGAYVISQAQMASDVLAVMLLQQQFGMTVASGKMMRVVPLFETLIDLTNAPDVLDTLFSIPNYVGAVRGHQEVMVGYSDSAKDAGRLAALWAQYTSQESMVQVASKHNIELTFFHGKGGTVGRGGNPALYRAILSHPPNTINGRFRITEQGEMITQNFNSPEIAERTLDIYTAAILRESFYKHILPTKNWREQMQRVSDISCEGYREVVRVDPRFVPYFRQATPELELGSLNIGSRPAKRNPKGGIESLRAIPWTFAWTQNRLHLSTWMGVGKALLPENEADKNELRNMYDHWPWFRENIDLIAMILSKTDFSISKNYDELLVEKTPELVSIGNECRAKLVNTRQAIIDVSGSKEFAGPHIQLLRASSKIRNPYVDPINCVQAELLREIRSMGDDETLTPELKEIKNIRRDALLVSIQGIAQGMRNSG